MTFKFSYFSPQIESWRYTHGGAQWAAICQLNLIQIFNPIKVWKSISQKFQAEHQNSLVTSEWEPRIRGNKTEKWGGLASSLSAHTPVDYVLLCYCNCLCPRSWMIIRYYSTLHLLLSGAIFWLTAATLAHTYNTQPVVADNNRWGRGQEGGA